MKLSYETSPKNQINFDLLKTDLPEDAFPQEVKEWLEWQLTDKGLERIENKDLPFSLVLDDCTVYVDAYSGRLECTPFMYSQAYLGEADECGNLVGVGIIKYIQDGGLFQNMPWVDWTNTIINKREGKGRRRLIIMNEVSKMLFGHTLSSSNNIQPEAESLWVNLVGEGLATPTPDRYRFLQ